MILLGVAVDVDTADIFEVLLLTLSEMVKIGMTKEGHFKSFIKELNKYNNKIMGQSNIMKYRMQKAT